MLCGSQARGLSLRVTYRFGVVDMLIWEIENRPKKHRSPKPRKRKANQKTDWETNLTKLRSKERALDAQSPVKPVKTSERAVKEFVQFKRTMRVVLGN